MENILDINLTEVKDDDLKELLNKIKKELVKRSGPKKVVYKHNCFGSSNHHFQKYKHYAKKITYVDDTKSSGYAFIGDFLNYRAQNLIEVGSYVIECCDKHLWCYKVVDDGRKLIAEGTQSEIVSFIKEVKEAFDKDNEKDVN